ncbi:hypothetical protein PNQ92_12910 [Halobacterium salinarum]|uniref:hypothetical protein n=1 Tax=Halobacterium salinarum TaxID=2242 RepID=UPI002556B1D2|nr:hypothetical protein [Halobacterium salinarum]MDL0126300.1 hypothetical protein [Halobacterium salinarum]
MPPETPIIPDDDRDRGILTPDDRKFLKGEKEYQSEQSERDARYRIRSRIKDAILDFSILLHHLDRHDREQVFSTYDGVSGLSDNGDELSGEAFRDFVESTMFQNGISDALSFFILGIEDTNEPVDSMLETGIAGAEEEKGYLVDEVTVEISVKRKKPEIEALLEKFEAGEPLTEDELEAVIRSGEIELDAETLDTLFERVSESLSAEVDNGDATIDIDIADEDEE